jgi:hypothetical protein
MSLYQIQLACEALKCYPMELIHQRFTIGHASGSLCHGGAGGQQMTNAEHDLYTSRTTGESVEFCGHKKVKKYGPWEVIVDRRIIK